MERKIEDAVNTFGMDKAYGKVILGLSGGADSTMLLHHFAKRAEAVVCVHVNHMIRGEEADRDQRFCASLCERYGVELCVHRVDIPALSKKRGTGIEETARNERYRIFNHELEKRGFDAILTAHNADDNCESVVFNLARGSGLNGLSGIKAVNGRIYRPLIYLSKEEILSYLHSNNIEYVTDSTNGDVSYTRNYIRHKIIPEFRRLNPSFYTSVIRTCASLSCDEDLILGMARDFCDGECKDGRIPIDGLRSLHPSVRARVYKIISGKLLDFKSVKACEDIIYTSECGSYVNLGGGVSFKKERDYAHFLTEAELTAREYDYPLADGLVIPEARLYVSLSDESHADFTVRIRKEGVCGDLRVRSKRDGDTVKNGGMTKKLKRIFCDRHIPSHLRNEIPIIEDGLGVLAVGDILVRDGCRPCKDKETMTVAFYKQVDNIEEDQKC